MTEFALSKRPRGVRKHWKAEQVTDLASAGEFLRRSYARPEWGDPVEARRYSYHGVVKKIQVRYANGRLLTRSFGANGTQRTVIEWL